MRLNLHRLWSANWNTKDLLKCWQDLSMCTTLQQCYTRLQTVVLKWPNITTSENRPYGNSMLQQGQATWPEGPNEILPYRNKWKITTEVCKKIKIKKYTNLANPM